MLPGLTRGEQATLDRALRMYASFYQDLAGRERNATDKADLLAYVGAADALIRRVRPGLQHAPVVSHSGTGKVDKP